MRLTIELTPDDLLDIEHDLLTKNLASEEFIRREIFKKGMEQNERNLDESGQFSQLFDSIESDIESDPMLFNKDEISPCGE